MTVSVEQLENLIYRALKHLLVEHGLRTSKAPLKPLSGKEGDTVYVLHLKFLSVPSPQALQYLIGVLLPFFDEDTVFYDAQVDDDGVHLKYLRYHLHTQFMCSSKVVEKNHKRGVKIPITRMHVLN